MGKRLLMKFISLQSDHIYEEETIAVFTMTVS